MHEQSDGRRDGRRWVIYTAHTGRTDVKGIRHRVQRSAIRVESPAGSLFVDGEEFLGDQIVADGPGHGHLDGAELPLAPLSLVCVQLVAVLRTGALV